MIGRARVSIVAAQALNGVVGANGQLPWHLPEDLKRFRKLTMGHPMVMGRKTFESIGKPLPGRSSIVLTQDRGPLPVFSGGELTPQTQLFWVHSLDDALAKANTLPGGDTEIFVIGGPKVWSQALEGGLIDRIYLTTIEKEFEGDVKFPDFSGSRYKKTSEESFNSSEVRLLIQIFDRQ